jgi:hypothetical protein
MKLKDFYLQPMGKRNGGSSGNRAKERMRASKHTLAVALFCMASSIFSSLHSDAQTTVNRSSKIVAGASTTSNAVYKLNQADYSLVGGAPLSATLIPANTIDGFVSIATDPTSGTHYALIIEDGVAGVVLTTISLQTGQCNKIAELGDNFKTIAFNANGNLFGITGEASPNPETMYRIDKATGALSLFRMLPSASDDEVLVYNSDNHYFYHWSGNPTDTWNRFDTTGLDGVETLTFSPTTAGAIGGLYDGGSFIVSNTDQEWRAWDIMGVIGTPLATFSEPVRGLATQTRESSITAATSTAICPGSSVTLEVSGGTGGYQWYRNGSLLMGETAHTLAATVPGVYNSVYADLNGVVDSPTTGITVTYLEAPSIAVDPSTAVCFGATVANLSFSTATGYTASGSYSYTVPAGVTGITFDISGAAGGRDTAMNSVPGLGGRLTGVLTVAPGDVLHINNGGVGADGMMGGFGGVNGGGNGTNLGGGGGGATNIYLNGTTPADLVAVAGGGGGAGYDTSAQLSVAGGNGGDLAAMNGGMNSTGSMAFGGDQTTGGAGATFAPFAPGFDGASGMGGAGSPDGISGGGGGGYFGGGGGVWSGGGAGSAFVHPTLVTSPAHTIGFNEGDGKTNIAYSVPASYSYSINWDAAAITAGFTNVSATAFPSAPSFPITIPSTAGVDIYNGTLVINNGICTSTHPFTLQVKMIPTVNATPDQPGICNGTSTSDVMFTGSIPTPNFNWTNNLNTIGIAATGSVDIMSFTAMNMGTDIDTADIIVTPELNGCFGEPDTFTYVVFPTPTLSVNNVHVCDNQAINYTATSATAGAGFSWERTSVPAGLTGPAPTATGTNTISETFDNGTSNVIPVTYTFTVTANGCTNIENFTANINPTPVLSPTPLTGSICDGDIFSFTHNSLTPGVVFSWSRAAVTGISNPAASGIGNINEVLNNTTTGTILVTYVDTLNINGCINTQTVDVNVNPTPVLSSSLTPPSVCDNAVFDYNATTTVAGTTITWTRDVVPGIANGTGSGPDTVNEMLDNTTENRIVVPYVFSLNTTPGGCSNTQTVLVTVNPTPVLNTTLTPAAICDSSIFDYEPGSNTPGATFSWTRAVVPNISNPAAFGTGNPNERLRNTVSFPVAVTYVFTTTIDGCENDENVAVTVNPRPTLSNPSLTMDVCDSAVISFSPTSTTLGTTYTWQRPFVSGIGALAATGSGNISERLKNNTNANVNVVYIYTLEANGCSRNQNLNVTVHPTPTLTSSLVDSACSGVPFVYDATTNLIPAHTLAWTRAQVNNITPNTGSGTGDINETLINPTVGTINVTYVYTVTIAGPMATCSRSYNVAVRVRPAAEPPVISTMANNNVCAGTMFVNYGAATPAASGNSYTWSASSNAEVYATGTGNQYALIHLKTPGTAVITLTSSIGATGCQGVARDTVTVGSDSLAMPKVIYTNGMFICLLNKEVVKSYQWGYDDANTLDSTILPGEINQSYINKSPAANRYYWVMVNDGDCIKKAYYTVPGDNTPRTSLDGADGITEMRVSPNPATDKVNVEVTTSIEGTMNVEVSNMLGQVVNKGESDTRRMGIDVATLPAGMYLIDCYVGGVKVGTAKFVKN